MSAHASPLSSWAPLAAGLLTLLGVVLMLWITGRRAKRERATAEEHRRQDWRREVHANFLAEQWQAEHMLTLYNQVGRTSSVSGEPAVPSQAGGNSTLAEDWMAPMARQLAVVRIFASKDSYEAARKLMDVTVEMASPQWGVGRYLALGDAKTLYTYAIRLDLGLAPSRPEGL